MADEGHLNPFRNHPTLCLLRNMYIVQKNEAFASNPMGPPWHPCRPAAQAWGTELMLWTVGHAVRGKPRKRLVMLRNQLPPHPPHPMLVTTHSLSQDTDSVTPRWAEWPLEAGGPGRGSIRLAGRAGCGRFPDHPLTTSKIGYEDSAHSDTASRAGGQEGRRGSLWLRLVGKDEV